MAERRPIKTRSHGWSKRLAVYLAKKNITPNQISLFSMVFAALAMIGAMTWNMLSIPALQVFLLLLVIVGVQGRLICNLLDGMVAIEGGKKTPAGELYNDIPDRVSDAIIFIGIGVGLDSTMPYSVVLGFTAALFAVLTAYIRVLGVSLGTPAYFSGPMAKQHRMAMVTLGVLFTIGCIFYAEQYTVWVLYVVLLIILFGSVLTCFIRVKKIKIFLEEKALNDKAGQVSEQLMQQENQPLMLDDGGDEQAINGADELDGVENTDIAPNTDKV